MKLSKCGELKVISLKGTSWYRAVHPKYVLASTTTAHTRTISSRFSNGSVAAPKFETLYLASSHIVAMFEIQALLGSSYTPSIVIPSPSARFVVLEVKVDLSNVVDLTVESDLASIDTTVQEMTGDWQGYPLRPIHKSLASPNPCAPTQQLGEALQSYPTLEGFLTFSAKVPTERNLVVFPQNLQAGSELVLSETDSSGTKRLVGKISRAP